MEDELHINLARRRGLSLESGHAAGLLNILAASPDHLSIVDRQYRYQVVSDAYLKAMQLQREEIIGCHVAEMLGQECFDEMVRPHLDACFEGRDIHYRSDFSFKGYEGLRHMSVTYTPYRSDDGEIVGALVTARDISDIRQEVEQLNDLAHLDSLTGLPNRRYITFLLYKSMARAHREGRSFTVAYCDLNDFKLVNDRFGHKQGDAVLKEAAKRLRAALRTHEDIGRFGGDEFLLVLDEPLSRDEQEVVRQRLRQALAEPFGIGKDVVSVGVSIGCARYPDDGESAEALIHLADQRMYNDKLSFEQ